MLTRGKVDFDQFEAHANVRPCMYFCIMWFLLARLSLNSSWGNRFESFAGGVSRTCKQGFDGRRFRLSYRLGGMAALALARR